MVKNIGHWFATLKSRYILSWFLGFIVFLAVIYPTWMSWARYMKTIGPPHARSTFKYSDFLKIHIDKTSLSEVIAYFGEPRLLDENIKVREDQIQSAGEMNIGPLVLYRWKDRHARVEIRVDDQQIVRWVEYTWFE